jgi:uncharacterized membrane protein
MPSMTTLGVVHTAFAFVALFCGFLALVRYKEISLQHRSGLLYVLTTAITAATSLGIYQHGGFGFQHILGILTLVGLAIGVLAARTGVFGESSRIVQAIGYSSTFLFHLLPGVTEALTRLPPGEPVVTSYSSPILGGSLILVVVAFIIGLTLQIRWLRATSS